MESPSKEQYTILRIKRKRRDEPLEALLIEDVKRKKSRGHFGQSQSTDDLAAAAGRDVFQYAETVEESLWKNDNEIDAMRTRITTIARQIIPLKTKLDANLADAASTTSASSSPRLNPLGSPRRYTILSPPAVKPKPNSPSKSKHMTAPPVVRSAREVETQRQRAKVQQALDELRMYDAVPVPALAIGSGDGDVLLDEDPEMESFLPMLRDYLRVNDIDVHASPPKLSIVSAPNYKDGADDDKDDDYVWDVFIHRTMSLDEWNTVALLGSVTGVPRDDDYPSDESEIEDEADEDSNEENWYGNDYPDEEESDEDSAEGHQRMW